MDYKESLSYLESLNVFGSKLGLSRIERLTELLGCPERRYKTVHVTGTNGKGSVSAMTAAILTESGFRTGLYTSPHLTSYTESRRARRTSRRRSRLQKRRRIRCSQKARSSRRSSRC